VQFWQEAKSLLEYVVLSDNEATVAGGAIYLSGRDTGLSILESTLTKNKANKGAVLGMSCIDYLAPVSRSITIASSSMIGNGGDDNISVIHGCGQTSLTIDTSTVAQNTANAMGGILYFADSQLNNTSTLTINSSTVVENKIAPALTYDALGLLSLNSSIIAFNDMGCASQNGKLDTL
jgi:hypothetical protein